MSKKKSKFETKIERSMYLESKSYCAFAEDDSFIEVTEENTYEGISILIEEFHEKKISMTWEQWDLLKKLVKSLHKIKKHNGEQ